MSSFTLVLSFILIGTAIISAEQCRNDVIFKVSMTNKALIKHTLATKNATCESHCRTLCFMDYRCISISYDTQTRLCNLSESDHVMHPEHMVDTTSTVYSRVENNCNCSSKNMACRYDFTEKTYRCVCDPGYTGEFCQIPIFTSCKDAYDRSNREDKAYNLMIDNKVTPIYCHLSSDICGSRGWTLVMKMDGRKTEQFGYQSLLWSNKDSFNLEAGQSGFDDFQTKMPSYWAMPFQKLCVGMKVDGNLKWLGIPYQGQSLYDVIADGQYKGFTVTKAKWMGLMYGATLQPNCNKEGFNIKHARLGIESNNEDDCNTPDSSIGFGLRLSGISCGNFDFYKFQKLPFGYILLQ